MNKLVESQKSNRRRQTVSLNTNTCSVFNEIPGRGQEEGREELERWRFPADVGASPCAI